LKIYLLNFNNFKFLNLNVDWLKIKYINVVCKLRVPSYLIIYLARDRRNINIKGLIDWSGEVTGHIWVVVRKNTKK